jgi:hypothetical protein
MSYNLTIKNQNGETVFIPEKHDLKGGTYCIGGTNELTLNITGNYWKIFQRIFGEKGTDVLTRKPLREVLPLIDKGIEDLGDAIPSDDYWKACDGNVKRCLLDLKTLVELALMYFPKDEMFFVNEG